VTARTLRHSRWPALALALLLSLVHAVRAADPMPGMDMGGNSLELFLSLQGLANHGPKAGREREEDAWGVGDIVFAASRQRLRLMGEYNFTSGEHDLERFQVGFEPVADTLLWLGRFHQPASAWNTECHHGRYLQTSITRPSIEFWEDEEGVVPQHLVGGLLETRRPLGEKGGLQFSLGVGYGSVLRSEGLEPIELLDRNDGGHRVSTTARLAFLPEYLGSTSAGLLFGHHLSLVKDPLLATQLGATQVAQDMLGAYVDWADDPWRLMGAAYHLETRLDGPAGAGVREPFWAGYVQVERGFAHALTLYARHENTRDAARRRYVTAFADDLVLHGIFTGLRWDLARRQALTIEVSRSETTDGTLNAARLQWSAAIP